MFNQTLNTKRIVFIKSFLSDFMGYRGETDLFSLHSDGSQKRFWRIRLQKGWPSFILVANPPRSRTISDENLAYLNIGRHLHQKGLPVPEIYHFDHELGLFILEDFGDRLLQDEVQETRNREGLYKTAIELLIEMQFTGLDGFDTSWCYQTERFDQACMRNFESNYFRDAFLINYLNLKKDWPELEAPFDYLARQAAGAGMNAFLHRDFQSRNLMLTPKGLGIIDWQGGRLGPFPYDLASLLIDPYVGLSYDEQDFLLGYYLDCLGARRPEYVEVMEKHYLYLAVQRNLQILGAYAFLSKVRGKTAFEKYISPAVQSLLHLLEQRNDPGLSPLSKLVARIIYSYT